MFFLFFSVLPFSIISSFDKCLPTSSSTFFLSHSSHPFTPPSLLFHSPRSSLSFCFLPLPPSTLDTLHLLFFSLIFLLPACLLLLLIYSFPIVFSLSALTPIMKPVSSCLIWPMHYSLFLIFPPPLAFLLLVLRQQSRFPVCLCVLNFTCSMAKLC